MKCIHCQKDSKKKEREGRKCYHCGHKFAFEPTEGDLVTDAAFQAAIERVSMKGQLRWGVEHLYYEICKRQRRGRSYVAFAIIGGALLLGAGVAAAKEAQAAMVLLSLAAFCSGMFAWALFSRKKVAVSLDKFNDMWSRWVKAHGKPDGVIERAPRKPQPPLEKDVADYSFDRAVICDRARTVDLLLANNFHFENNCAILAINGYPQGPFETVRAMLKRNPKLQVYALHDATPAGCRLAHLLSSDPAWFSGQAKVIEVGLRPAQAKSFKGLLQKGEPVAVGLGITAAEAAWLSDYSLELAAIRPEQVLKRLFAAINNKPEPETLTQDSAVHSYADSFDSFG